MTGTAGVYRGPLPATGASPDGVSRGHRPRASPAADVFLLAVDSVRWRKPWESADGAWGMVADGAAVVDLGPDVVRSPPSHAKSVNSGQLRRGRVHAPKLAGHVTDEGEKRKAQ